MPFTFCYGRWRGEKQRRQTILLLLLAHTPTGSVVKKGRQESYAQPSTRLLQTMSKENSLKNLLGLSKKKAPPGGEDKEEEEEEEEEQQQQQQNTARASEPTLDAKQRWHRRGNKTRNRTGARGEG
jgi:hypothetical protein